MIFDDDNFSSSTALAFCGMTTSGLDVEEAGLVTLAMVLCVKNIGRRDEVR